MHSSLFRSALVLGLLSAIGPFSIDMYLPAMPDIGADLGAPETQVQMTITLYFLAFGVSQFLWGPMADAWGRKLPLLIGIGIFAVGSVLCAFAPTIGWLIAARFLQGIGGQLAVRTRNSDQLGAAAEEAGGVAFRGVDVGLRAAVHRAERRRRSGERERIGGGSGGHRKHPHRGFEQLRETQLQSCGQRVAAVA